MWWRNILMCASIAEMYHDCFAITVLMAIRPFSALNKVIIP